LQQAADKGICEEVSWCSTPRVRNALQAAAAAAVSASSAQPGVCTAREKVLSWKQHAPACRSVQAQKERRWRRQQPAQRVQSKQKDAVGELSAAQVVRRSAQNLEQCCDSLQQASFPRLDHVVQHNGGL